MSASKVATLVTLAVLVSGCRSFEARLEQWRADEAARRAEKEARRVEGAALHAHSLEVLKDAERVPEEPGAEVEPQPPCKPFESLPADGQENVLRLSAASRNGDWPTGLCCPQQGRMRAAKACPDVAGRMP